MQSVNGGLAMIRYKKIKFFISCYDIDRQKTYIFNYTDENDFNNKIKELDNSNCYYEFTITSKLIIK